MHSCVPCSGFQLFCLRLQVFWKTALAVGPLEYRCWTGKAGAEVRNRYTFEDLRMLRKTFLELQRRAGQSASASSGARGYRLHEAAQCTALRPAASVFQVACQNLINKFEKQSRQELSCCAIQVLTPAQEYSTRAYWWPQSSGFAAQADQEGSATPDSEDGPETSQAAGAGANPEQEPSQQESTKDGADAESDAETISYDELEPEELRAELLQRDTALTAQAAEASMFSTTIVHYPCGAMQSLQPRSHCHCFDLVQAPQAHNGIMTS